MATRIFAGLNLSRLIFFIVKVINSSYISTGSKCKGSIWWTLYPCPLRHPATTPGIRTWHPSLTCNTCAKNSQLDNRFSHGTVFVIPQRVTPLQARLGNEVLIRQPIQPFRTFPQTRPSRTTCLILSFPAEPSGPLAGITTRSVISRQYNLPPRYALIKPR